MTLEKIREAKKFLNEEDYLQCISLLCKSFDIFIKDDGDSIKSYRQSDLERFDEVLSIIKRILAHPIFIKNKGFSYMLSGTEAMLNENKEAYDLEQFKELGFWLAIILEQLDEALCDSSIYDIYLGNYNAKSGYVIKCEGFEDGELRIVFVKELAFSKKGVFSSNEDALEKYLDFKSLCSEAKNYKAIKLAYLDFIQSTYYELAIEASQFLLAQAKENENIVLGIRIYDILTCIGASYFFLKNYEKAIDYYLKAYQKGECKEDTEFNVWEACVGLIKLAQNDGEKKKWKTFFKNKFPNSPHEINY